MGRLALKILSNWTDCDRCSRSERRLGVAAPAWGVRPTILIVGLRADRVAQAVQEWSPRVDAFVSELAEQLKLAPSSIVVDSLLACGLGHTAAADHVAACSARFVENSFRYGAPRIVLVVGEQAHSAVRGAGLVDPATGSWSPIGARQSHVVLCQSWSVSRPLIHEISRLLQQIPAARPRPPEDLATAGKLLALIGDANGSASKELVASAWRRRPQTPLSVDQVAQHLRGARLWGAFRPTGPWPFVVVDVDQHDALQARRFNDTMYRLRELFPSSLVVKSSKTGGAHVYVRLPPGTQYEEAASWLEAFLATEGLLIHERVVPRSETNAKLRSVLVEVPRHPVRLPFGHGSTLVHPAPPTVRRSYGRHVADMVDIFGDWLKTAPHTDYQRAKDDVAKQLKRVGTWTVQTKRFLNQRIEQLQLGRLQVAALPTDDPWTTVLPQLDSVCRVLATRGVPAFGMRTRCMQRLVGALLDLIAPGDAEQLMVWWLYNRPHQSEDIEADVTGVEVHLKKLIKKKAQELHGVPVRVWELVEVGLSRASRALADH